MKNYNSIYVIENDPYINSETGYANYRDKIAVIYDDSDDYVSEYAIIEEIRKYNTLPFRTLAIAQERFEPRKVNGFLLHKLSENDIYDFIKENYQKKVGKIVGDINNVFFVDEVKEDGSVVLHETSEEFLTVFETLKENVKHIVEEKEKNRVKKNLSKYLKQISKEELIEIMANM